MKPVFRSGATLILLAAAAIFFSGCDKRNDPDLNQYPYRFFTGMVTDGNPTDVKVAGNYVAVSNGSYGAFVLDKNHLDSLRVVLNYVATGGTRVQYVAIDAAHSVMGTYRDVSADTHYGVFDITKAGTPDQEIHFTPAFSSNIAEMDVTSSHDTMIFWATDFTSSDRKLTTSAIGRADSSSPWDVLVTACHEFIPDHGTPRGFDIRRSDGMFAVANEDAGLFLFSSADCRALGEVNFSGSAYDCAWYGNYVVVAANNIIVIVDATDLEHPAVISSLVIPTADRQRKVAVDGQFACVLDEYDGVYVLDISKPRNPQYVQLLNFYGGTAIAADNGKLYCTATGLGLRIYSR